MALWSSKRIFNICKYYRLNLTSSGRLWLPHLPCGLNLLHPTRSRRHLDQDFFPSLQLHPHQPLLSGIHNNNSSLFASSILSHQQIEATLLNLLLQQFPQNCKKGHLLSQLSVELKWRLNLMLFSRAIGKHPSPTDRLARLPQRADVRSCTH